MGGGGERESARARATDTERERERERERESDRKRRSVKEERVQMHRPPGVCMLMHARVRTKTRGNPDRGTRVHTTSPHDIVGGGSEVDP